MKKRFVSILFCISALGYSAAITAPPCGSLSTFAALTSAGSCALGGGFVVKNPDFSSSDSQTTAANINLSAFFNSLQTGIAVSSGRFLSPSEGTNQFVIRYTIDPQPDIISIIRGAAEGGGQDSSFAIAAGTAAIVAADTAADAVSVLYQFCVDQPFQLGTAVCNGRPFSFVLSIPDGSQTFSAFADLSDFIDLGNDPTNTVGVIQTIVLNNGGFVGGAIRTNLDLLSGEVPEPGTLALLGGGLAALVGLRRAARL